ncbi:MAG: DNA-binding protein [Candidatus Thorarchaeota archaeon]
MTDDDTELAMLRRKKMAQLIKREKELQATKERQEKVDLERNKLLARFLAPDAASYLDALAEREPQIATRIRDIILYLVTYRGIRRLFNQIDVRYIERQVKGEEPKIRVQRDGETSDFGDYVKEALKKNGKDV